MWAIIKFVESSPRSVGISLKLNRGYQMNNLMIHTHNIEVSKRLPSHNLWELFPVSVLASDNVDKFRIMHIYMHIFFLLNKNKKKNINHQASHTLYFISLSSIKTIQHKMSPHTLLHFLSNSQTGGSSCTKMIDSRMKTGSMNKKSLSFNIFSILEMPTHF